MFPLPFIQCSAAELNLTAPLEHQVVQRSSPGKGLLRIAGKKLSGAVDAPATREGWTFRREFEHASVFVDVEMKIAKIDWK